MSSQVRVVWPRVFVSSITTESFVDQTHQAPSAATLLQARNLSRKDPVGGAMLLHDASCDICPGDRIVLSGPSGSGKSVFMRCLAMLDAADSGQYMLKGKPVARTQTAEYRSQVAYIRQRPVLLRGSVEDNLTFPFALQINRDKTYDRQKITHFLAAIKREVAFLDKAASALSGGEMQLVCLLRVLQLDPCLLLLDEPTSALDETTAQRVEDLITHWMRVNGQQTATVWISHDEQQKARVGDRIWQMNGGRLATDGKVLAERGDE